MLSGLGKAEASSLLVINFYKTQIIGKIESSSNWALAFLKVGGLASVCFLSDQQWYWLTNLCWCLGHEIFIDKNNKYKLLLSRNISVNCSVVVYGHERYYFES